jgi:hypothetical protein
MEPVIPAAIVQGFLYLGSYDTASRSGLLKTMGITHILNVSRRLACWTQLVGRADCRSSRLGVVTCTWFAALAEACG